MIQIDNILPDLKVKGLEEARQQWKQKHYFQIYSRFK